ncbi:two-component regulator propeller domain-containing protein [Belliella marina]|uniref:histidine kinase n=1 Tax=Belliella marina TaxID=1644146 RepID=A0ABW4VJ64_9BACT
MIPKIYCLIVFLMLLDLCANAQYTNLRFENFSTVEGLSSSTCVEIFQDSEGFLWFGTIDGLNRYDGYGFEVFRPVLNDANSISNNRINSIVEDSRGNLWIGTGNGLNVFDRETEGFHRIELHKRRASSNDTRNVVNDLFYDAEHEHLWVATKNGLSLLNLGDVSSKSYTNLLSGHYISKANDPFSIDDNNVTSILKDKEGAIWIGTDGRYLNKYIPETDNFERVLVDVPSSFDLDHLPKVVMIDNGGDFWIGNDLSRLILWDRKTNRFVSINPVNHHVPIFDIYQDKKGMIWLVTDGFGIFLYDKQSGLVQHIEHNPSDPFSLPNNQVSTILEDRDGIFWIATYNKGVSKLALSKSIFGHYFYQPGNPNTLSTQIAQSVLQDSKGNIWIGTDGGGLNLFEENSNTFTHFRSKPGDPNTLSSDKILYLLESFDGKLWVCTWDGGLNKFDPTTGKSKFYKHTPENPNSIGQNTVWCAAEDSSHRVWLGTQSAGLNLFNPSTGHFSKFTHSPGDSTSIMSNFVFSVFIDSKQRLFVGTALGLNVVDLDKLDGYIPSNIRFEEIRQPNLHGNRVNYITEDSSGNIWIGTDLGLHKLNNSLQLIKSYSTQDGLSNNLVLGIVEDKDRFMWITTKSGLSRLDPDSHGFKNFNIHDGLQGMEFQSKSIDKTRDGRIIAGGINGFNIFHPEEIHQGTEKVTPIITEFRLLNKQVSAGDTVNNRILLKQSIANTKKLELKHYEGHVQFSFVALNYQNPERIHYAYRMKGLDESFIGVGQNRTANYSNLSPGNYVFEVKAAEDGLWGEATVTSIIISVLPPPWKTWWAYTIYVILLILAFWLAIRYYTRLVKDEKERELDQMKLRFFINVSHEFRTPLTLILNPVDKILSAFNDPEEVKTSAYTIQRSARRLLNLVNQLLDLRKMDLGKERLHTLNGDILKFGKDIFLLFEDLANLKNIDFRFESGLKELPAIFDPDKIEKIITNLLSNALKFTEPGGKVVLSISKLGHENRHQKLNIFKRSTTQEIIEIRVKDTGIGFKREHLKDVFSRFFHVDSTKTGTGIGLNFTKGLVELHGGEILVESEYQIGSTFIVRLPLEPKLKKNQKSKMESMEVETYGFDLNAVKSTEYELSISDNGKSVETEDLTKGTTESGGRPVVLIVEDNRELRIHLKKELSRNFKVREANNGAVGLEKVSKLYPDVIISDVMMPEMDGFELCRRVKTNFETCHIPVVLLTARSLEEDRIEGYNTGADEYLPKPFNINVLQARIFNLLESKKRLRDKFTSVGGVLPSSELTTNNLDEVFLDKATKVVLENIDNQDYSLDELLVEIGISRSQFYRKINSLTGQNPSKFIRTIRLKYASELLLQKQYTVKEIAYMSGFNSTAYFGKTFRELFGQTPNQFVEANDNQ